MENLILTPNDEIDTDRKDNRVVQDIAEAVERADLGVMFLMGQFFRHAWTNVTSIILYPFQFVTSTIEAVTAWRDATLADQQKDKNTTNLFVKAGVYTASALAIGVSLAGIFFCSLGSILVAPILMTAAYGIKALYNLGSGIYNAVQASLTTDEVQKSAYKELATDNFAKAASGALITVALGLCLFLHKATFGIIGMIGGFLGAGYCAYQAVSGRAADAQQVAAIPLNVAQPQVVVQSDPVASSDLSHPLLSTGLVSSRMPPLAPPSTPPASSSANEKITVLRDTGRTWVPVQDTDNADNTVMRRVSLGR